MKKVLLAGMALLLLTTSLLSGCLWVPVEEDNRRGDYRERDRGEHRGEHHEDHEDHGDRR